VGVVASLASVEGAIAALIAIIGGEPAPAVLFAVTPVLLVGLVLVTIQPETSHYSPQQWTAAVGYGVGAGAMFGASLYATGRVAESLPAVWAVVPSRFTGVVFLFLPLLVLGRVRIPRAAIPWVVGSGVADTAGFAFFALGSHSAIAVAAVLASQFAVLATVMAALVFRERLTPRQNVGVAVVALGVASVAALRAATA
jgi:drug/metabolite transporter (DMT)-like permease